MSFLDALGSAATAIGQFTGLDDAWHDMASAFSENGEDDNLFMDVFQGMRGLMRVPSAVPEMAYHTIMGVGQVAQTGSHYVTGSVAYTVAMNHYDDWKMPGETRAQYHDRVFDQTISNDGLDPNRPGAVSLGQVITGARSEGDLAAAAAGGAGLLGFLPVDEINPLDPKNQEKFHEGGAAPWTWSRERWMSGGSDLSTGTAADPSNLLGPLGKPVRALSKGAQIVSDAEKANTLFGRAKNLGWTMSDSTFVKAMDEGKFDDTLDFLARSDQAEALVYFQKSGTPDAATAAAMFARTKTRDEARDMMIVTTKSGTAAEQQQAKARLIQAAMDRGEDGLEDAYLLNRITEGSTERIIAGETGADLLTDAGLLGQHGSIIRNQFSDPDGPLTRAWQQALDDVSANPLPLVTHTPARSGTLAGNRIARAEARAANGYTVYGKASPLHPTVAVVNAGKRTRGFFTRERASGLLHLHDTDSYKEIDAMLNDLNEVTGGALASSGEARGWMNRYLAATTEADRGKTAKALERRGMDLLAKKHGLGLTEDEVGNLYRHLTERRRTGMESYKANGGYLSTLDDNGEPLLVRSNLLERQAPNSMLLFDFRDLNRALREHKTPPGAIKTALQGGVETLDIVNNIFKTTVLMRLGYTVRNVAEAGMSSAMTGYGAATVMTAGQTLPQAWMYRTNRGAKNLADRIGVMTGRRTSAGVAERDVALAEASLRAAQDNYDLARSMVGTYRTRLSAADRDILANRALDPERHDLLVQNLEGLADLQAESTRQVTYHMSSGGGIDTLTGDFIDTVASPVQAKRLQNQAWTVQRPVAGANTWENALTALRRGQRVQYRTPTGQWRDLDVQRAAGWAQDRKAAKRKYAIRFREQGPSPTVLDIPSYGDTFDLTRNLPDELAPFKGQWDTPEAHLALRKYAEANGIGRYRLNTKDGATVRVMVDSADYKGGGGYTRHARDRFDRQFADDFDAATPETLSARTPAENRAARRQAKRDAKLNRGRAKLVGRREVIPGWTEQRVRAALGSDAQGMVRAVADELASARANYEFAIGVRQEVLGRRLGPRRTPQATGARGNYPDAGATGAGQVMFNRTDQSNTYEKLLSAGDRVASTASAADMTSTVMQPGDTRYFEGWANILNHHFRDPTDGRVDPLVMRFLEGEDPASVSSWATDTAAGRRWADNLGIDADDIDDAVHKLHSAVEMYLPDELVDDFLNGTLDEIALRTAYADRVNTLHPLVGLLVPTSPEAEVGRAASRLGRNVARKFFHYFGNVPETAFARHPLYIAHYRRTMDEQIPRAQARLGRDLTVDEVHAISAKVAEQSRRMVNETLFTINRRTGAARQLRIVSPFYAAWENSIRRWSRFAVQHTERGVRYSSQIRRAVNNLTMVNLETGEIVTDPTSVDPDNLGIALDKTPGTPSANITIPVTSLDVILQGQAGPGLGPVVIAPLAEITKRKPSLEEFTEWAFPAGLPRDVYDAFAPMVAREFRNMLGQEGDILWANTRIAITQGEMLRFQNGERDDLPTDSEITDKTRKFFMVRVLSRITSPVSLRFNPVANYYAEELRRLKGTYGEDEGEDRFLASHPEAWMMLPSRSNNRAGAWSTTSAVENLEKYSDVVANADALDPKLMGWVANYGQTYDPEDFSQAAYQWQLQHSPATGSPAFRTPRSPEEFMRDAEIQRGWDEYVKIMDAVEARMAQDGIDPISSQGQEILSEVRRAYSNDHRYVEGTTRETPWYQDYRSGDDARYSKRAEFFQNVIEDPTFMADHKDDLTIKALAAFLEIRSDVQSRLIDRREQGLPGTFNAKANADLQEAFLKAVAGLKEASVGFADLHNRFFTNDTVLL